MEANLQTLSEDELEHMIENARRALRDKQDSRRKDVLVQIKRLASSIGVGVEIVDSDKEKPARTGKVAPKYRNPDDPSQTWTGRGMKPVWLRELINGGRTLEEFEIKR